MRINIPFHSLGFTFLVLLGCLCRAETDTLITTSGQINGIFKSANSEAVVMSIAPGHDLIIPWAAVQKLTFGQEGKTVLIEGPGFANGKGIVLNSGDTITFNLSDRSLQLPPPANGKKKLSEVRTIAPVPTSHPGARKPSNSCIAGSERSNPTWYSSIGPKFGLTEGTQSVQTISGSAAVRRAQNISCGNWHHQETTVTINANNTLTEQVGSPSIRTDEYDASFLHQIYLTPRLYTEFLGEAFHNSAFNLYLEQSYGGGIGGRAISGGPFWMELSGGAVFVGEHFSTTKGPAFAAGLLSERSSIEFGKKDGPIVLSESTSYLPAIDQANAWQLRGTVQLAVPITSHLTFVSGFVEDYMQNAANSRKNYSTTSVGVNFSLGQN